MKVLICIGTRPEAVKMAPLYFQLKKSGRFQVKLCITAQHREMLDQVLEFFEISPDFDLNLMTHNQTLNQLSARILLGIEAVLISEKPNLVLVHGDTTTSIMVTLAAFHNNIKIGHVEAGLRTYDKNAPFPEEINRQMTGRMADYHFAPTSLAKENLLSENVFPSKILVTGNTVIDALYLGLAKIERNPLLINSSLIKIFSTKKKIILVTIHRRENFGIGFERVCNSLLSISENEDVNILFPVHLNPMVQVPVNRILGNKPNIILVPPMDYPNFIYSMNKSYFIISDSGGVQEEAPSLGKPVLVIRDATERPEAIEAGIVKLVGTDMNKIVTEANKLLNDKDYYLSFSQRSNPYGNGRASEAILTYLSALHL